MTKIRHGEDVSPLNSFKSDHPALYNQFLRELELLSDYGLETHTGSVGGLHSDSVGDLAADFARKIEMSPTALRLVMTLEGADEHLELGYQYQAKDEAGKWVSLKSILLKKMNGGLE